MTFLILVNWFSIAGRMLKNVGDYLDVTEPAFSQTAIQIHAAFGAIVALFATYLAIRMWFENQLPDAIKIRPIKLWMRLTLVSWLGLIVLGTYMYFDVYSN